MSGQQVAEIKTNQPTVGSLIFSPDGTRIVTGSWDGTVRLWALSGQQVAEMERHQGAVYSMSFSPDGKFIATAGNDGKIHVQSIETLDQLLNRGCIWLQDYLRYSPDASDDDRKRCKISASSRTPLFEPPSSESIPDSSPRVLPPPPPIPAIEVPGD
ncbi:MAG: hypothetical protein HC780_09980 [Leptolyngbyaceae cyanobacterium CSU_1_3]|nr:hypothetical protein [Leptolyngbyaceae cyanobacterium CSU_1_3]